MTLLVSYRTFCGFDPRVGPADCPFGHFFGPGTYQRSWMACMCPPATEPGRNGHDVWRCGTCAEERVSAVCYSPPHCPVNGQGALTRSLPDRLP
jgi:hypothetical protein